MLFLKGLASMEMCPVSFRFRLLIELRGDRELRLQPSRKKKAI